jgi:leader peptidase (prepilin peptidase)/N-methyltransferase
MEGDKMAEAVINEAIGVLLLCCSIEDLRRKKVLLWMPAVGFLIIGICVPFADGLTIWDRVGGFIVGVCVVAISIVTKGKIGTGDGILLCITGIGQGLWGNLELLAFALLGASVISILLLVFRRADRKKSIPFVPFLLFGFLLYRLIPL